MGVWSTLCAPWFGLPEEAWPITGIKSTHVIWREREAVKKEPAALFCAQEMNGTHLEIYPRSNGDMYACGIGGSDYVEDRSRLAVGGDCEKPSSVQADYARVLAANDSAGKLSSLLKPAPGKSATTTHTRSRGLSIHLVFTHSFAALLFLRSISSHSRTRWCLHSTLSTRCPAVHGTDSWL